VKPAIAAPKTKASSLRRFTGMLITSAASGSSRNARHARPVLESWTKYRRIRVSATAASRK
jgi:ribosomal protein L17